MLSHKIQAITPKVGMRFLHARILNPDNTPMMFQVMQIKNGDTFYAPIDKDGKRCGGLGVCRVAAFGVWCREVVK